MFLIVYVNCTAAYFNTYKPELGRFTRRANILWELIIEM